MRFAEYTPSDRAADLVDLLCDVLAGLRRHWLLIFAAVILLWQPLAYVLAWIQTH